MSLTLFALGLMSKPMLVTLPVVLLFLDYWPLGRAEPLSKLAKEKLPFLALSALDCVATYLAQHEGVNSTGVFALPHRIANALASCIIYLWEMVWPTNLALLYPYPRHGLPAWEVELAATLLTLISGVVWVTRRRQPWLLAGWLWYLAMLLPVLGLIQVGGQAHADRYTYLPQIGIYVAITWLFAQCPINRAVLRGLMGGVLVALMICAVQQVAYWHDSVSAWTRTLACTKDNYVAHCNLGIAFRDEGLMNQAANEFEAALQINPDDADSHNNLGTVLRQEGKVDEAINEYRTALSLHASSAEAHYNLAIALGLKGRLSEAIGDYQEALRIDPANVKFQNNLAWVLATGTNASLRNGKEAVSLAEQANALTGGKDPTILDTLAAALAEAGQFDEAKRTAQTALQQAQKAGQTDLVKELTAEFKLYEARQPCRD